MKLREEAITFEKKEKKEKVVNLHYTTYILILNVQKPRAEKD